MANKKITDLVEITSAANVDVLPIVDVSVDITNKIKVENLPISTATQTALDAKQETLVSGTNIKTINSTSILGSGDVAVQPTLVSGTNIKTINSTSLLGSGDIAIAANPAGTAGQIQFSDGSAFAADSNLFWDNTNKRLGVGTATPDTTAHFSGGVAGAVGTRVATFEASLPEILLNDTSNSMGFSIAKYGSVVYFVNTNASGGYSSYSGLVNNSGSWSFGGGFNPVGRVHIKGSGSTFATTSLLVQNSSGQTAIQVKDDKSIAIFGNRIYDGDNTDKSFYISGPTTVASNFTSVSLRVYNGTTYASGLEVVGNSAESRVGIGTTSPDASAKLQLDSTTKGFLPPRMTTTQKNAITTPAAGLVVYDTDTNKLCCYNGSTWNDLF